MLLFSFIQYFNETTVPAQPNNSSLIRSCFLLGSNTPDIISVSRKTTPEPPTTGSVRIHCVWGQGALHSVEVVGDYRKDVNKVFLLSFYASIFGAHSRKRSLERAS